jgi:pimeloyl-ACP methyl ester carboxylesterase
MRHVVILMLGLMASVASQAQSRSVNVGDAVITYEITGSGAPLVLIHGWAQDMSIWDDQVRDFSRQYRVLRYDRRGFGCSTGHAANGGSR